MPVTVGYIGPMVVVRILFAEAICSGVAPRLCPRVVRLLRGVPLMKSAAAADVLVLSS